MLDLEFAHLSDRGRVRGHNEDYLGMAASADGSRSPGWLFALADGVGGQAMGEVASRLAVETMLAAFPSARENESYSALLPRLVQDANLKVYEAGQSARPGGVAMATTIVACALRHDRAVVSHVGDSRCYRIRRGECEPLTRDHTVAGEHHRLGMISAGEYGASLTRHVLSRSLGSDLVVAVETHEHPLFPGDLLLLCSDGLHGALAAAEIAEEIGDAFAIGGGLPEAVRGLVDLANRKDGSDNVSAQLIRIRAVERVGMYRGRPYKLA